MRSRSPSDGRGALQKSTLIGSDARQRVFSVLQRHGRQRLRDMVEASYLNRRQISYGLVILIQQHLVFHSPAEAALIYYEIDWQQSYALVRHGKIAKLVEDRYGKKAANVISNLLTLGHTRIADLKDAYFPPETENDDDSDDEVVNHAGAKGAKANGTQVNGTKHKVNGDIPAELEASSTDAADGALTNGDGHANGAKVNGVANETGEDDAVQSGEEQEEASIKTLDELYDAIQLLMERGWVIRVEEAQYLSPGDLHALARQQVIDEAHGGVNPTGIKDKANVAIGTTRRKRRIRDTWLEAPQFFSRKRKANDSDYGIPSKRAKLNGGHDASRGGYGQGATSFSAEDELVIRVNPEKIAVAMRNEQLVHLVEQRLGYVTARVYQTMLRILESNLPRCFDEWADPPPSPTDDSTPTDVVVDPGLLVTARDVAKHIKDLDICEGLDPNAVVQITKKAHVETNKHDICKLSRPVDVSKLTHDERVRIIDKHIQLLSEDPFHFVTWHSRAGFSQWHVEFDDIAKSLIQLELENTIASRKGALGVKLIRALRKKGKLDERQACNAMMMPANDIRGIVNDLTVQGFVQTQEIPRVERREAKHSIHLIWYDRQRAREKLLHDTYKGMVRIMQRIAFEREKVQPLLAKAERSDVVGNEAKYLSKNELDALKKWKDVQEKLLLQLFREDDLVATLRDFIGPLVSV